MLENTPTGEEFDETKQDASSWSTRLSFSRQWVSILIVTGCCLLLAAIIIPFLLAARQDARRLQSKNNLKQLGLAFHNYHDVYQQFPIGADVRSDGTAMHGWIIRLVPYLESSPLYSQINQKFPWEHPANSHLFKFRHPTFLSPNHPDHFTSEGFGLTHYLGNPNVLHRNTTTSFSEMTTGTAHNWLAGEISSGFHPFAYPFNWRELKLPFNDGKSSYGSVDDSTNICLADGSVSTLSHKTDQEVVRRLAEAPPVATDDAKVLPTRVFRNSPTSSWTREFFLAAGEDNTIKNSGEIWTTLHFDPQGELDTASLYSSPDGNAAYTVDGKTRIDLHGIVETYPEVRVLILNGTLLSDDAAKAIASCSRIETVVAHRIQISDAGREHLRKCPTLKWVMLTSGAQHKPMDIPDEWNTASSDEF
jgi:hypothetical protein